MRKLTSKHGKARTLDHTKLASVRGGDDPGTSQDLTITIKNVGIFN